MPSASQPLILVTNDDGIYAPGIRYISEVLKQFGEVCVVAPDKPQSGMGHAITINSSLRITATQYHGVEQEYACSGTPVDCVKMAVNHILKRRPDLVVSGINHGSNSSINVIYSGTMSAAVEGALEGASSIGISVCDYRDAAVFDHAESLLKQLFKKVLENPLPKGICLNVNIPAKQDMDLKGVRVVRQAKAHWVERFEERKDPYGRNYYWLTGNFVNFEPESNDTDEAALSEHFISVVPIKADMTAHEHIASVKYFENVTTAL